MILAGFLLLAVGAADLVRQFVPRTGRWIGFLVTGLLLVVLGTVSNAFVGMLIALAIGALWVWLMPADDDRRSALGFWPAVLLAGLCALSVVWIGAREQPGLIDRVWQLDSPLGAIPFELAVLTVGVVVFLLESANLVVRAALDGEGTWRPREQPAAAASAPVVDHTTHAPGTEVERVAPSAQYGFKGGRLIGPLERVIVLMLTLTAAYPVLAAMLAAKGIVRFPEISKDGTTGARAEYFLVGSLVSWVIALGGALSIWWAANS